MKNKGPSTLPCGSWIGPTDDGDELFPARRTYCMRLLKYEAIHSRAVPPMPYDVRKDGSNVPWSMLSKASDRTSKVRTDRLPESNANKMSETTLSTAVSVEWFDLYADCKVSSRFVSWRYASSCLQTSRSSNFEITERFEIGRYDLTSVGSRSALFSSGVMYAVLNLDGNVPFIIDRFNRWHKNGDRSLMLSLSRFVGSGSRAHYLSGSARIAAATSSDVTGENDWNEQPSGAHENEGRSEPSVAARTPATLFSKCR
jgi:hypothetical protein